ncbi:MAG: PAS domain S-box protein [Flavobacteriales bacterium]|nr:PAS domain S-box protein [Flavobacteriales bacterium]
MPAYKKIPIQLDNYRNLFEHSQDGIYFTSLDGKILEVNRAFLDISGYAQEEISKISSIDLYVNPKAREKFQKEILSKETVRDFEVELYRKDKSIITCLLTSSVFKDETGEVVGFRGLIKDITILKAATGALKTSEKRFRVLFHGSPDPIFVEDLEGNILDANPAACDLYEMLYTELVGKNIFYLMQKEAVSQAKKEYEKILKGESKTFESVSYSKKYGETIPVEINVSKIKYLNQPALLLHVRDITKRKEAEKELIEERRKRLFEITDIQEREKKRIARELHDGIGQMLFGTKMHLESLRRKVKGQEKITQVVTEIESELKEIIAEVRALSRRLRPSILDDFGLIPALSQLFEQFQNATDVKLKVQLVEPSKRFNSRTEVAIYRIVQEALNNAVRHGKSSIIWVYLEEHKNNTELVIRDNGEGFDSGIKEVGHGLKNMKERTETIGGQFEMSSVKGRGTVIKIVIPNSDE